MLFFLNLDGTVTRSDTDHVYQGQNKVANVELFTLISPAQAAIQVAFTLPNGLTSAYMPMSYVGAYSVDESNQKQVHRWKLAVPYNVTEAEGQVGVSFNILLNDGTNGETQETINQTTYTSSFFVEYSALPVPPTTATESELEQLLTLLNLYYTQNASLAKQKPFVVGEVTTETLETNEPAQVVVEQSAVADSNGNYPTNFAFSIPKGATGATGIQGPQGPQGPQGAKGPAGKDGTNGKDGYSTFVAAVDKELSAGIIQVPKSSYQNIKLGDRFILLSQYSFQQEMYTQIGFGTVTYLNDTTADVSYAVAYNTKGTPGKDGYSTYLYDGALSESVTSIDKSHIAAPTGRFVQAKDIVISTFESTFGAMAQVVAVNDTIAAVKFIGTLQGGAGASNYNTLSNIPVINQDLTASGFTPVANTYYRHTGATTATFTQGVIYLYDTAYHKLGESGGTTLNRYVATGKAKLMTKIIFNAKSIISFINKTSDIPFTIGIREDTPMKITLSGNCSDGDSLVMASVRLNVSGTRDDVRSVSYDQNRKVRINVDGTIVTDAYNPSLEGYCIEYWNDTEIIA